MLACYDVASLIVALLSFVIKLPLQTGTVTSNWKVAQVTTLHKKVIKLRLIIIGRYLFYRYFQKF